MLFLGKFWALTRKVPLCAAVPTRQVVGVAAARLLARALLAVVAAARLLGCLGVIILLDELSCQLLARVASVFCLGLAGPLFLPPAVAVFVHPCIGNVFVCHFVAAYLSDLLSTFACASCLCKDYTLLELKCALAHFGPEAVGKLDHGIVSPRGCVRPGHNPLAFDITI